MNWTKEINAISNFLSYEKISKDIASFFKEINYFLMHDEKRINFNTNIIEKMLIINQDYDDNAYFLIKVAIDPVFNENNQYLGFSYSGVLKIMYDLKGKWIDEFYSRDNVIESH